MRGFARYPSTLYIVVALAIGFVLNWIPNTSAGWLDATVFRGSLSQPWTLVTYPFAGGSGGFVATVFLSLWLVMIGGSLDARFGRNGVVGLFLGFSVLGALCVWAITVLTPAGPFALAGAAIPEAALTAAWAAIAPKSEVRLFGAFPVQARWIALFVALMVFFTYGQGAPLIGIAAVVPCISGWFLRPHWLQFRRQKSSQSGRGGPSMGQREFDDYLDKVRSKEHERAERDRLRKMIDGE